MKSSKEMDASSCLTETKLPSSPAGETAHIDPNSGKPHFTHTQVVPDSLGADISGPKGSGGAAPEAAAAQWYECSKCGAGISSKRKGLQRCITGGYCDPESAAPIAPAAQELVQELVTALRNVVEGNDLALARQKSIENWRNSDFRRHALAALARAERKEGEAKHG